MWSIADATTNEDYAFVTVDHPAVVVEAVKAAEDGSGDMIVRCYESFGGRAEATLAFDRWFPLFRRPDFSVRLTDFLEDDAPPEPQPGLEVIDERTVRVSLRPFQIATLRLTPRSG